MYSNGYMSDGRSEGAGSSPHLVASQPSISCGNVIRGCPGGGSNLLGRSRVRRGDGRGRLDDDDRPPGLDDDRARWVATDVAAAIVHRREHLAHVCPVDIYDRSDGANDHTATLATSDGRLRHRGNRGHEQDRGIVGDRARGVR